MLIVLACGGTETETALGIGFMEVEMSLTIPTVNLLLICECAIYSICMLSCGGSYLYPDAKRSNAIFLLKKINCFFIGLSCKIITYEFKHTMSNFIFLAT